MPVLWRKRREAGEAQPAAQSVPEKLGNADMSPGWDRRRLRAGASTIGP